MHQEIIFSGFGGQGALFAGQLLAYAALDSGLHVTWIPSYGPEMRGGPPIAQLSLPMSRSDRLWCTGRPRWWPSNLPSFEKYEPRVKPGGLMVYNESLIPAAPVRSDIRYVPVPANDIAEALGNVRQANVVLLGAYLAATGYLALEAVKTAVGQPSF